MKFAQGGFPCQDISIAGKQKGIEGERSGLWKEFFRIIKEVEPRYAIIENVANLRGQGLATVIKDLWSIGYDCEWHIISARSVGACHLRERIWIITYPDGQHLRIESGGSSRPNREEKIFAGVNGQNGSVTNSMREGLEGQWMPSGVQAKQPSINSEDAFTSNTNNLRLWRPFASQKEKSKWWTEATTGLRDWWKIESAICRVDDGLSRGLDKGRAQRIKQLGNSVVPQIPELIGRAILEYEKTQAPTKTN